MKKHTSVKNISELEFLIIEKVKSIRSEKKISRQELSRLMGLADSFVGKVESYAFPDKYNLRHLALIAKALKLKSTRELLPTGIPEYDIIEVIYEKVLKTNKDGSPSKQFEEKVISIEPIK